MKIKILENTRINSEHVSIGETHDVEDEQGKFLISLGRAERVLDKVDGKVKAEDIVTKGEALENVENREVDMKKTINKKEKK